MCQTSAVIAVVQNRGLGRGLSSEAPLVPSRMWPNHSQTSNGAALHFVSRKTTTGEVSVLFFYCFGRACGTCKFLGQGRNPRHSCDLCWILNLRPHREPPVPCFSFGKVIRVSEGRRCGCGLSCVPEVLTLSACARGLMGSKAFVNVSLLRRGGSGLGWGPQDWCP